MVGKDTEPTTEEKIAREEELYRIRMRKHDEYQQRHASVVQADNTLSDEQKARIIDSARAVYDKDRRDEAEDLEQRVADIRREASPPQGFGYTLGPGVERDGIVYKSVEPCETDTYKERQEKDFYRSRLLHEQRITEAAAQADTPVSTKSQGRQSCLSQERLEEFVERTRKRRRIAEILCDFAKQRIDDDWLRMLDAHTEFQAYCQEYEAKGGNRQVLIEAAEKLYNYQKDQKLHWKNPTKYSRATGALAVAQIIASLEMNLRPKRERVLRLDNPTKENGKYRGPAGRSNMFYIPLGVAVEWLKDISIDVVFVEGEKKALALWRIALENMGDSKPLFIPIGLRGVY